MYLDISMTFLMNVLMTLSLALIYSVFTINSNHTPKWLKLGLQGFAVSVVGVTIMSFNHEVSMGIFFDSRSIVTITSGMYFGLIPTLIGSTSLSIYRIIIGGPGTIPGVLEIIIPAIIGLTWHYKRLIKTSEKNGNVTILEQYTLIFFAQALVLSIGYLFPNRIPYSAINQMIIPFLILNPFGGLAISIFMNINRRNHFFNQNLKQQKTLFNTLFNQSNAAMFIYDIDSKKFIDVNEKTISLYGYSKSEFQSFGISKLNPLPDQEIDRLVEQAMSNKRNQFIAKHFTKNGATIFIETLASPISIDNKRYLLLSSTNATTKMTQKNRLENMQLQLDNALKSISDGIILIDKYGDIETINQTAQNILHLNDNHIGQTLLDIIKIEIKGYDSFKTVHDKMLSDIQSFHFQNAIIYQHTSNEKIHVDLSFSPLINHTDAFVGSMIIFRDITKQLKQFEHIQFISQHDSVTQLYNRYFLETELKRLNTKRQLPISYIIGDVNGLKLVNDAFSHDEGDRLLIEIGTILSKAVRSEDILGRWGGDEFLIILPQTSQENALHIIKRIEDLCHKSYYQTITPSIALGIGTKTKVEQSVEDILLLAEKNMYAQKTILGPKMRAETYLKLIERLNEIDPYFTAHHKRSKELAVEFGRYLKRSKKDIEMLGKIAENHDIGKISLSQPNLDDKDPIIQKTKRVRLHVESGYRILNALPNYADISKYVLHHHENWDGSGYPEGLKGEAIPYFSRVVRIIEMYDSLMHHIDSETMQDYTKTIEVLRERMGSQLDPNITEEFIAMTQKTT